MQALSEIESPSQRRAYVEWHLGLQGEVTDLQSQINASEKSRFLADDERNTVTKNNTKLLRENVQKDLTINHLQEKLKLAEKMAKNQPTRPVSGKDTHTYEKWIYD